MMRALNVEKLRLDLGEYLLSIQGLRLRRTGRDELESVDLDVKRASCIALVGPPGAGKSALLACIAGVRRPSDGRIRYLGYELRRRTPADIVRAGVARVTQEIESFAGLTLLESTTVGALVRRPTFRAARAYAREMLALVELGELEATLVQQLDPFAQRLAMIAAALATQPQLLLLDDPWERCTVEQCERLNRIVARARARSITIIAATCDVAPFASLVDEIATIERGITRRPTPHASLDLSP